MATKSTFDFEIVKANGRDIILITDLNKGISVTNDIENVVDYIGRLNGIDNNSLCEHIIIYRDSSGEWDGWNHERQCFVLLQTKTFEEAIIKYTSYQNESSCV